MMSVQSVRPESAIKLLAMIEASSVTGPAKNLVEFCRNARSRRDAVEASIVTFSRAGSTTSNQFIEAVRAAGLSSDVIDERHRFDLGVLPQLRKAVARHSPDIIQTHNVKSHFLVWLSGLWREMPWIAFHHGYTTTNLKMRAYNQLDRLSLKRASRVITVSEAFARDLQRLGVARPQISVLHNSIDVSRAAEIDAGEVRDLRSRLKITDDERVVLAVGRMSREKGHTDLVAALDHLRRLYPEMRVRTVIVGSGPEQPRIESVIDSFGLGGGVVFAGQVADVRPYYGLADALVLPSHSEGSPNVLLEAMAADLPVVATRVGGVPEIITHDETGLLVEACDPRSLAREIGNILVDAGLARRLASRARRHVAERHSPESRLARLVEIYRTHFAEPVTASASVALWKER
ncbi:MAG TPA: glycosyltransferase family 4 protein [Blastocatellia bacterium]|nr:glycosyltransferase family 4 protein [Blastocatellia bacterium]